MTDAPERIWIDARGGNWSPRSGGTQEVEYTRADLAKAQAGALLRQAADDIADYPRVAPDGIEAQHYDEQIAYAQQIILALDPDAVAALDRYVGEAVKSDPRVKALVGHLERWLELASHCAIEEGICCCGDNMDGHSDPMNCGHSPVDHGSYIAQHLVESTSGTLRAIGGE